MSDPVSRPDDLRRRGRRTLIALAVLFLGPLLFSLVYHRAGFSWRPAPDLAGTLVQPPRALALPAPTGAAVPWKLVMARPGPCAAPCRELVERISAMHVALGRYAGDFERVYVAMADVPAAPPAARAVADADGQLRAVLTDIAGGQDTAFFLVDPGNLVIARYDLDFDPRGALHDLNRLARRVARR